MRESAVGQGTGKGMRIQSRQILVVAVTLAVSLVSPGDSGNGAGKEPDLPEQKTPDKAPAFTLKDQWRSKHRVDFPNAKPLVIGFADRYSAYDVEKWYKAVEERYGNRIFMRGVAALDDLPFFWRPWVRPLLRREVDYESILLDWSNEVAEKYDFVPRAVNVHVVARDGTRLVQVNGKATKANLARVFEALDKIVEKRDREGERTREPSQCMD